MASLQEIVTHLIELQSLPTQSDDFLNGFLSSDRKTITVSEGQYWDYKEEFPFAWSDNYFYGISRLVCAFHNSYGGLIIFGIKDNRDGSFQLGKSKVKANVERLNQRLRETLTVPVICQHKNYQIDEASIDIILVPKRTNGNPVRFKKGTASPYRPEKVWLRKGPEVLEATGDDIFLLYGPRKNSWLDQDAPDSTPNSAFPAQPTTIKELIGRFDFIDALFTWLMDPVEPRVFLWGDGGSGKSTIAYHFGRLIARLGHTHREAGEKFSQIIYLSAKETQYDVLRGKITDHSNDFSNRRELFEQILWCSEWMPDDESIRRLTDREIEDELGDLFNTISLFIIIDDIDTLSRRNIDTGMDRLFLLSSRAKQDIKILYTQRGIPTQSIDNAIEVEGLDDSGPDSEYRKFVKVACEHFKIPAPPPEFVDGKLSQISNRRPLIVESILGLRRTCGSYDLAISLFEKEAGGDARRYLYDREYERLDQANRERLLLAALALSPAPLRFLELQSILRFSPSQLNDAIGNVQEIFLALEGVGEDEQSISVTEIARAYLLDKCQSLDRWNEIKERVQNLRKKTVSDNPAIRDIRVRVEGLISRGRSKEAWTIVENPNLDAKVSQNPHFIALRGLIACKQSPPLLSAAISCFRDSTNFGHLSLNLAKALHTVCSKGDGFREAEEVCLHVIQNKKASAKDKGEFFSRLGVTYFKRAGSIGYSDQDAALEMYLKSLVQHLAALTVLFPINEVDISNIQRNVRNTAMMIARSLVDSGSFALAFQKFSDLHREIKSILEAEKYYADPLAEPLLYLANLPIMRIDQRQRVPLKGQITRLLGILRNGPWIFHDPAIEESLIHALELGAKRLQNLPTT